MIEGFLLGLYTALSVKNMLMVIGGCIIGTFIGMLPGLGPMSIIAIMIPVAISIGDPAAALILLAGVYYGAVFGGSTSSILINAPGVASTVATSFDGYPLTRQQGWKGSHYRCDSLICWWHSWGSFAGIFCSCFGLCGFAISFF